MLEITQSVMSGNLSSVTTKNQLGNSSKDENKIKMKLLLILVWFVHVLEICQACNTYNNQKEIHLHVYDCDEMESEELGKYITKQTKSKRFAFADRNTCEKETMDLLSERATKIQTEHINPERASTLYTYQFYTYPERVFAGPRSTTEALMEGKSFNIVLDKNINFYVFYLKDKSTNATMEKIMTTEDISNVENDKIQVIRCEHLLYYLSKNAKPFSITISNYRNSNPEYRFWKQTGGIGGFYKKSFRDANLTTSI